MRRDLFRRRQLAADVGAGVVVEADLEAGRGEGGDEEEVRMGLHEGGEVVGGGVAGVDVAGKAPAALVDPAEGEFETVAPAAALEGRVGEVPAYLFFFSVVLAVVVIVVVMMPVGVLVEEVSGFDSVGAPKDAHVAREQKGAGDGDAEHLVRVGCDAAGTFYPLDFVLVFVGEDGGASPGAIDVQPQAILVTEVCDIVEWVAGAQNGRSGCDVDEEGFEALEASFFQQRGEGIDSHSSLRVHWYLPHVLGADTACLRCFRDAIVAVLAGEDDQIPPIVALVSYGWKSCVACYHQRGEIGCRASRMGATAGVGTC